MRTLQRGWPLALLAVITGLALLAPALTSYEPRQAAPERQLEAPSRQHPLGTDLLGRDVWSRTLHGGRRTLGVAMLSLAITLPPGLMIGLLAAYTPRGVDGLIMAPVDALLAIPNLLLALAIIAVLRPGFATIALAVGISGIAPLARVARSAIMEARHQPHIVGAQAIGAGPLRLVALHVLPSTASTLLPFAAVLFSWSLLNSAALAFLGYGGDISAPEWGAMLADARRYFRQAPWVALAPGLALTLTVLAVNALARRPFRV